MVGDTHFQRYLPDPHPDHLAPPEQIRRHILCSGMCTFLTANQCRAHSGSGQVYHALLQERDDKGINDVVISRVEQISPFPYDLVRALFFTRLTPLLMFCR